jgi:hypothetical protein
MYSGWASVIIRVRFGEVQSNGTSLGGLSV